MDTLAEIESLLKARIGLDAASIGRSSIERAIEKRIAESVSGDLRKYHEKLVSSETELQSLIEAVVVPETWFFRDSEAFLALSRLLETEHIRSGSDRPFRLLSLPCSTGEEAYTMAMALLDAEAPSDRFQIDAVDISAISLSKAREGVYGNNSFRGKDLRFRDRYFQAAGTCFRLTDAVRARVRFIRANMLEPGFLPGQAVYDAIFCRNLLIYFDRPTQDRAVHAVRRLLKPGGLLFVGPAESGLAVAHGFVSVKIPLSFAFRNQAADAQESPVRRASSHKQSKPRPAPGMAARAVNAPPRPTAHRSPAPSLPRATPANAAGSLLESAAKLADEGHLAEAARLCRVHLREQGDSGQAYYLLGLVRDAAGETAEAAEFYRKALYLIPDHYETLVHLSYLKERQGDCNGAKALQNRARRAKEKTST